jgi:branched-chain amino acid transport system substrate-binding protein
MAISDFEKKYHPNYKIEMISADHQDKADITSNKAREWFDREHVDMITDLVSSIAGLSAMKVAKEKDKIVIITGAGSSKITNAGCNDVTVHYVYDTYATGQGTAKAVVKQGGKTWFFFNS